VSLPQHTGVAYGVRIRLSALVRVLGVARGFALAVLRTVIVPSLAIAGVGDASGYVFVLGQINRHG